MLSALDGALLREAQCLFAGGTAMALRFGEYRESVDMDFLVSDLAHYRELRQLLISPAGINAIVRTDAAALTNVREVRADQYGIRTQLQVDGQLIKFEIVLEARIVLAAPGAGDEICGIATLTPLDMAASKLLANSDRWPDDGVFSRDVIDLAMMNPATTLLQQAIAKAEEAYGAAIRRDLDKAILRMQERPGWLERCMQVMEISTPKAVLWQRLKNLRKGLGA